MKEEKLVFTKGTVSKGELQCLRVEPRAKEICDRISEETGLSKSYVASAMIMFAEGKVEIC